MSQNFFKKMPFLVMVILLQRVFLGFARKKEMVGNVCSVLKDGFVFNYPYCKIQ